jgi:hypothetical protein
MSIELFCFKQLLLDLVVYLGKQNFIIFCIFVFLLKVLLKPFYGQLRYKMSLASMSISYSKKMISFNLITIN